MEITLMLYNFAKRENSTKKPTGEGAAVPVVWQSPYDVVNPTIECRGDVLASYNYAYIPEFGRYYWLDTVDKYRDDTHAIVHCVCDVLATYADDILSQSFYVELSQSSFNTSYNDGRLPVATTQSSKMTMTDIPALADNPSMMYYMEVVGTASNGAFTDKYIVSPQVMSAIAEKALNDVDVINEWAESVVKKFGADAISTVSGQTSNFLTGILPFCVDLANANDLTTADAVGQLLSTTPTIFNSIYQSIMESGKKPWDCIVKIKGLACDVPTIFNGTNTPIYLGSVNSQAVGKLLVDGLSNPQEVTIPIPWIYDDFRNSARYTTVSIAFPNSQCVNLPTDLLLGLTSLTYRYRINAVTGDVVGYLYAGDRLIADVGFNIGVDVCVAQKSEETAGTIIGAVGTLGSLAAGLATANPAAIAGAGKSGAMLVDNLLNDVISARGISSQCCLLDTKIRCSVTSKVTAAPSSLNPLGRLLMSPATLSSLSGYTKCSSASASLAATRQEIESVNNLLNSGFYIES